MKKAQILGQVFIYILTIIIFGIILLYGYRAIKDMGARADQVLLIQLKKEMVNAIEKTDYGSVTKQELTLPNKYGEVCFVDLNRPANGLSEHPLVYDSWDDNVEANMFLIKDKTTVDSYYIGNIEITNPYYRCVKAVQGKVTLRLEGKGRLVELSEW